MKVLHVIAGLDVGGAELMLKRLIGMESGSSAIEHSVVSLTGLGRIGEELRQRGTSVDFVGMGSLLHTPRALWRLVQIMRQQRPDVVQTWMYHADLIGGVAARLAGVDRIVWGVRATDANLSASTRIVRTLCAVLSRCVPHRIVCAAEASRAAHAAIGYRAEVMTVIPNGFDMARWNAEQSAVDALRASCGFGPENIVIGTIGSFSPDKDQRNFVAAAAIVARSDPRVRFMMIGRGCDGANPELLQWIGESGCGNRFALLGERRDVPVCLAALDVFCLASSSEGFPNVVGEAMAMRRPCVVTDVGDASYLLGGCGELVPPRDSLALANALLRVVGLTPIERAALGERGRERVATEFTMARSHARFVNEYGNSQSICETPSSRE